MRAKSIIILLILVSTCFTLGARTVEELFVQAPDGIVPLLDKHARMDMVDYFNYGLSHYTKNELGGNCRIVECNDSTLLVEMSASATVQFAILPNRGDTLVALVETIHAPQADSGVRIYHVSDWSEVEQRNDAITVADFFPKRYKGAMPPIYFASAQYDAQTDTFVFTNTTAGYYSAVETPEFMAVMLPTVRRRFDGRRWKTIGD